MEIIPAIDIKEGRCVRLRQGRMSDETVYSDQPAQMAKGWEAQGARWLHVVDLDGAVSGVPKNFDVILQILKDARISVQVGGGLRDTKSIQAYLEAGAQRVVLGTTAAMELDALKDACRRFPDKIVVAIDSQDGKVAIRGWQELSDQSATVLARQVEGLPLAGILVTDIRRDGMMSGPNLEVLKAMVNSVRLPVIASGGIRSLQDIQNLMGIRGLWGGIIGKALYEGALNLKEAISLAKGRDPC